jgi:AcrR family transcriptional regulator
MKVQLPLRELKKERTKEALESAALRLFRERGYAETSVAEIAAEAEVSRRTFFRYFRSKEGVVFANADENGRRLQEALEREPLESDPLSAFGNVVVRLTRSEIEDRGADEILARQRLFVDNLGLRSRLSEIARVWRSYLAEALARREGRDAPSESDLLYAAIGITVIQTVLDRWTEDGGADDLADRLADAFGMVTVRTPSLDR